MPMMGGVPAATDGRPKTAPNCSPPKNQNRIAARLQTAAEVKKSFGCGKKDTNTVAGFLGLTANQRRCCLAGIRSHISGKENALPDARHRTRPQIMAILARPTRQ